MENFLKLEGWMMHLKQVELIIKFNQPVVIELCTLHLMEIWKIKVNSPIIVLRIMKYIVINGFGWECFIQ